MATYNGSLFINEQINSILAQLGDTDELIISDDRSTDNTMELISKYKDARLKVVENKGDKGVCSNFENSLKLAKGKYIFLSDQDDMWFPNKISIMCSYLINHDLVNCDCIIVDDKLNVLARSYSEFIKSGNGFIKNFIKNRYIGNCMAFNRKILEVALPFPKAIPYHDWWIGLIAEMMFKPVFIEEQLGYHRRHDGNESNTFDGKKPSSLPEKIKKRYNLIRYLPAVYIKCLIDKF